MAGIKAGIVGTGFIGAAHIDALRRVGFAEVTAVADMNGELAKKKAEEYCIPKCYRTVDELLADPEIQVVHNCTPNNLHKGINEKSSRREASVFRKPLAISSDESAALLKLLGEIRALSMA